MNLHDVMSELAAELDGIAGLRVFGYPADNVQPPAAVLGFPESYMFDETYGRGSDRLSIPVFVVVSRVSDRTAIKELSAYVDGSGPKSVKATLEGGSYTAMDSVRVTDVEFVPFSVGAVEYWAAMFSVDVFG